MFSAMPPPPAGRTPLYDLHAGPGGVIHFAPNCAEGHQLGVAFIERMWALDAARDGQHEVAPPVPSPQRPRAVASSDALAPELQPSVASPDRAAASSPTLSALRALHLGSLRQGPKRATPATRDRTYALDLLIDVLGDRPIGDLLATADGAGNVLTSSDYRPYGSQALGTPEDGPGYAGHVNDADSGLVYMQARYYDPAVARFFSTDPASAQGGSLDQFNRFAYAKNNPVSNIDPDGKESVSTMIHNGAEGCGAVSCAGWALLRASYEVGSLGFSSVHDPMRDAYDAGAATQEDYVKIGVAGGAAVALSDIAIGEVGGKAVGAAVSRATSEGSPLVFQTSHYAPRVASAGLDVAHVESVVGREVSATLQSASKGTTLGPFSGRMTVNQVPLEFRAFPLQDGRVSVGTIFPIRQVP